MIRRQEQVLDYIDWYQSIYNNAPTYKQICERLGINFQEQVHRIILSLEKKGKLKRELITNRKYKYHVTEPVKKKYTATIHMDRGMPKKIETNIDLEVNFIHKDKKDAKGMLLNYKMNSKNT